MLQSLIIISTSLTAVLAFGLGVFTITKSPKSKINVTWFLTSLAVTVWCTGYMLAILSKNDTQAFINLKIVYLGAVMIPIFFFHFVLNFLYKEKKYKYLLYLGYILSVIFLVLILGTRLIISGVRHLENFGNYEEVEIPGFNLFLLYFGIFSLYAIYLLIKGYFENDGIRRKKILYIILAAIITFVGGTSNFVTDLTGIYPYGQMIVWLYPVLITYGIFLK